MNDSANKNAIIREDENHNQMVQINEIIFKGKQHIDWDAVRTYALRYIDAIYIIASDGGPIHLDKKFADEFAGSIDTKRLRGKTGLVPL